MKNKNHKKNVLVFFSGWLWGACGEMTEALQQRLFHSYTVALKGQLSSFEHITCLELIFFFLSCFCILAFTREAALLSMVTRAAPLLLLLLLLVRIHPEAPWAAQQEPA